VHDLKKIKGQTVPVLVLIEGEKPQVPRLRSEAVTFLSSDVVCGRKARKSICQEALPGSFDCAHKSLCYAIDLRSASLRMTTLWGACNTAGWICRKHERSKKSQALGMTRRRVGVFSRNWFEGSQVSNARPHGTPGQAGAPFDFTLRCCRGDKVCHFSPFSRGFASRRWRCGWRLGPGCCSASCIRVCRPVPGLRTPR
jgi:hypothetical protein